MFTQSSLLRRRNNDFDLPTYQSNYQSKQYRSLGKTSKLKLLYYDSPEVVWFVGLFLFLTVVFSLSMIKGGSVLSPVFLFGKDVSRNCPEWASAGRCRNLIDRPMMLMKCPHSCHTINGVSIETLSERDLLQDALSGFTYFLYDPDDPSPIDNNIDSSENEKESDDDDLDIELRSKLPCRDYDDQCVEWAEIGLCVEDGSTMIEKCRKSCQACFGQSKRTVTIDFGVEQETNDFDSTKTTREDILNVVKSTAEYMRNDVFVGEDFEMVRKDCRNLDPRCSIYAAEGECHGSTDALAMYQNCAPACHACEAYAMFMRCRRRPEHVDAIDNLNVFYETIMRDYSHMYPPTIISQPNNEEPSDDPLPWILQFDNFLTHEECDWLIAKGHDMGFEQTSTTGDDIDERGEAVPQFNDVRVGMRSVCTDECEEEPMAKQVYAKILKMAGVPFENSEYLEIDQFKVGGHYLSHQDLIDTQGLEKCGNRIVTFYMFLSDAEEGGELRFNYIRDGVDIKPKKGAVVIYPNVAADDLTERQDWSFHEWLPLTKGVTYGAHFWVHPRNLRDALMEGCCY